MMEFKTVVDSNHLISKASSDDAWRPWYIHSHATLHHRYSSQFYYIDVLSFSRNTQSEVDNTETIE